MNLTIDKTALLNTLSIWNRYLKRKVQIIACGGTALTLLNLKESTKLESPLEPGNHIPFIEFSSIYLGILNYYDLIIAKLFRYTPVDIDDCLILLKEKKEEINIEKLKPRFYETSSCDISDEKNRKNFKSFLEFLKK